MSSFLDLQNGFYNAFSQGLGFPPGSPFQMIQPAPPLPAGTNDATLWAYFNNIPPNSLTQNYIAAGGNQFFSDYRTVLSALRATNNTFQADIGAACLKDWFDYLKTQNPLPAPSQLPTLFLNWASIYYPTVAQTGASDLSAMLLDPIGFGQAAMMPYNSPSAVANWSLGYNDLVPTLANAPQKSFQFDSSSMNSNVSNAWASNSQSAFFGVWTSSDSSSSQSAEFASSGVSVSASFDHLTTFVASPGNWYSSGTLGDAFSHGPGVVPAPTPWNPASTINWDNTFGANGNMQRFAASLVVASGMRIVVTSQATFSSSDQSTIQSNKHLGLWPFYTSDSGSSSSTQVTFDAQGRMTSVTTSVPGVPIVLGCNVITAAAFLGHANAGRRLAAAAAAAR